MAHTDFAEWYRIVSLTPPQDQLEKRWQAIEQIVATFTAQQMLDVVRLFQPDLIPFSQSDLIIQAFQTADPVFPKRNNDIELQVLAASTIIDALSKDPTTTTDLIALASVCSSYADKRKPVLIPEARNAALKYLSDEGQRVRLSGSLTNAEHKPFTAINAKKLQEASDALSSNLAHAAIVALNDVVVSDVNAVREILNRTLKNIIENQKTLALNHKILSEEIEISWWLTGEWSRDLDQPYSSLPLPFACVLVAKELADITVQIPGPPSAKHLIDKMLRSGRDKKRADTALQQAINSASRDWRSVLVKNYSPVHASNICPVLMAAQKTLETDGKDDWVPAFKKATNLDSATTIDPLSLAYQAYLECLLVRTLQEAS